MLDDFSVATDVSGDLQVLECPVQPLSEEEGLRKLPDPIGFLRGKSAVNTVLVLLPPYPVRHFGFGPEFLCSL